MLMYYKALCLLGLVPVGTILQMPASNHMNDRYQQNARVVILLGRQILPLNA